MSRLPPPPRFILPPPPMPPSDIFDIKIISQLTCSSIRQQYQQTITNSRLILFASASVVAAIILFTITLVWFLSSRKRKQSYDNHNSKPSTAIDSMNDLSTCSNCSYDTVSSDHTGVYLESVDTSATTCSTDATDVLCVECYRQHGFQPAPYYHILNIPDVVPT